MSDRVSNNGSVVQPSAQQSLTNDNEDSLTCAEFWPSPIAWARHHEADAPADSIDLFVTPSGFDAAHSMPASGAVWGSK